MPRRHNNRSHEQENHERWLVSYADFITLLFAFFVVMYSISSVNDGKYKVLSETLIGAFNVSEVSARSQAIDLNQYVRNSMIDLPADANKQGDVSSEQPPQAESDQPARTLNDLSDQVEAAFANLIEDDQISINGNEHWVEISLSSNLLFQSGSAYPNREALPIIQQIASILDGYRNPIHVEGFTDNVPISSVIYPSNWELSAARSATVVRLLAEEGIAPGRLAAVGYGEYQPFASNDSVTGRNENRRVVLVVSRDLNVRRSVTGAGESANTERELELRPEDEQQDSFLIQENRVRSVELQGGGVLFTQDPEN